MAMTEGNKRVAWILAGICGFGLLVCIVCGIGGALRFSSFVGEVQEQAETTTAEASAFARTHDQIECRDEGLRRKDACNPMDFGCAAQVPIFMDSCMREATPTPGFCDGVPRPTEIMATATWATAQCTALGRAGDQQCPQAMQSIQRVCYQ
jgi:hypothetical protein